MRILVRHISSLHGVLVQRAWILLINVGDESKLSLLATSFYWLVEVQIPYPYSALMIVWSDGKKPMVLN